jgi:hypothetical protein
VVGGAEAGVGVDIFREEADAFREEVRADAFREEEEGVIGDGAG